LMACNLWVSCLKCIVASGMAWRHPAKLTGLQLGLPRNQGVASSQGDLAVGYIRLVGSQCAPHKWMVPGPAVAGCLCPLCLLLVTVGHGAFCGRFV
jgi:hypothetical protein